MHRTVLDREIMQPYGIIGQRVEIGAGYVCELSNHYVTTQGRPNMS